MKYQPYISRNPPNIRAAIKWIRRLSCGDINEGDEDTNNANYLSPNEMNSPPPSQPKSTSDSPPSNSTTGDIAMEVV